MLHADYITFELQSRRPLFDILKFSQFAAQPMGNSNLLLKSVLLLARIKFTSNASFYHRALLSVKLSVRISRKNDEDKSIVDYLTKMLD